MDRLIQIKGLAVMVNIGASDEERSEPQRLLLDVSFVALSQPEELNDDLSTTIDYHAVSVYLERECQAHPWQLIETLADKLSERLLTFFPLLWVEFTVRKFILPNAECVAVTVKKEAHYS
ncbi:MAG: dihydroneopterin aldolase [Chthoniobacterales bacterium]|nr:dihydroneopterin aldolase [Chthoniobacterales bacterium]